MYRLAASLVMIVAVAACGGSPAQPTAAPTGAPTAAPTGGAATAAPTAAQTPADAPTQPAQPGASRACFLSAQEMSQIVGSTMSVTESSENECTYGSGGMFPIFVIRVNSGETIEAAKMITTNGRDLTIGGLPAYYGELMGGILYVQRGSDTFVIQAPLQAEEQVITQMQRIAEAVIPRW